MGSATPAVSGVMHEHRHAHLPGLSPGRADDPARDRDIGSDKKLVALAQAIVRAFDFQFDHAFGFYSALTGREVMRAQPRYEVFADMAERDNSGSVKRTRVA